MPKLLPWLLPLVLLGVACDHELTPPIAPSDPERLGNVFLVTLDTLRADHLSCLGYPRQTSTFLDHLADDGALFIRAFASSSTTIASHASLFTSLEPPQHQMVRNGMTLSEGFLTLAELFADAGYRTAGFSSVGFMAGVSQGFERFDTEKRYYPAEHVIAKAEAWLDATVQGERHLVWLHLFDVHEWPRPHNLDDRHRRLAAELEPSTPEMMRLRAERGADLAVLGDAEERRLALDRYDGQILAVDAALEGFFQRAEAKGWNERALWIVTSDHGEGLGDHGYAGHGAKIYNEQLHVPLIFSFADRSYGGRRIDRMVRLVDVLPTLAELLGTTLDRQIFPVVGRSLLPLLTGRDEPPARYAFAQRREADASRLLAGWESGEVFSLQSERYKYIYRTRWEDEFYDLAADPFERDNRIYYPNHEKVRMRRYLARFQARLSSQGRALDRGGVKAEYLEQLKALGYL